MPVQILSEEERRRRGNALQQLHYDWATGQADAGVDGPVPPGRKDPSDYNQHVPDLEADGTALDEFFAGVDRIIGQP
jgi:hypothetical protein